MYRARVRARVSLLSGAQNSCSVSFFEDSITRYIQAKSEVQGGWGRREVTGSSSHQLAALLLKLSVLAGQDR
jgi:flagellar biosynthesis/type III secretory pathway ATPase